MAILRSLEGDFYEIPDDQLQKCQIPPDQVREKLEACGVATAPAGTGPGAMGYSAPGLPGGCGVVINILGSGGVQGPSGPPPQAGQEEAAQGTEGQTARGYHFCGCGWANWHNWFNWHNHHGCGGGWGAGVGPGGGIWFGIQKKGGGGGGGGGHGHP